MGLHNSEEKGCELACDSMQLEKGRYYYREIRTIPNMLMCCPKQNMWKRVMHVFGLGFYSPEAVKHLSLNKAEF